MNGRMNHFAILRRKAMYCGICLRILSAEGSIDELNL